VTPFGEEEEENGEMRASVWVAQRPVKLALNLQEEDGTYFQFFNLKRSRVANSSTVSVNGKALDLWKRFGQLIWWTLP
jgi:hypothetical protein